MFYLMVWSGLTGNALVLDYDSTTRVDVVLAQAIRVCEHQGHEFSNERFAAFACNVEVQALALAGELLALDMVTQQDALVHFKGVEEHQLFFIGQPVNVLHAAQVFNDVLDGGLVVDTLGFHQLVDHGRDATQLTDC